MDSTFDAATAYHEAGHAVAALALGRPVQRVTILPDRQHLGLCLFGKGATRPTDDWLEREILIALGGLAAEARYTENYAWEQAGKDLQHVRRLCVQRAGERQAERLERRMLAKAEHLLSRHGKAVELIAGELLKRGAISGRTARDLFDRACAEE